MTWSGDISQQVRREFMVAQRMKRGHIERVSDEREEKSLDETVELVVKSRRRIIQPRETKQ